VDREVEQFNHAMRQFSNAMGKAHRANERRILKGARFSVGELAITARGTLVEITRVFVHKGNVRYALVDENGAAHERYQVATTYWSK